MATNRGSQNFLFFIFMVIAIGLAVFSLIFIVFLLVFPPGKLANLPKVSESANIKLVSPAGNEILFFGGQYNIVWTSSGLENIKIELLCSNVTPNVEMGRPEAETFVLADKIDASLGMYSWKVEPEKIAASFNGCEYAKIRLKNSGATGGQGVIIASSDNLIKIKPEPAIKQ